MKKQPRQMRLLRAIGLLAALLAITGRINAQTIQAAANADPHYYTTGQPTWMNNAARVGSSGTLYAVVWDDGAGTLTLSMADDVAAPNTDVLTFNLVGPGFGTMSHPDVIVGGDVNSNYYVMASYTVTNGGNTNIYCESYVITNVGSGYTFLIASNCGTNHVRQVSTSNTARDSHIDIANDATGTVYTNADVFVIAWEDAACAPTGGSWGATAKWGFLSNFAGSPCGAGGLTPAASCLNNSGVGGDEGEQVDVAVRRDWTNGNYEAFFTFDDKNAGNVLAGRWHLASPNNVTVGAVVSNPGANAMDYPRIDVLDDKPLATPPQTQTQIVYRYWDGVIWQVASVNSLAGTDVITYYFNGPPDHDNSNPVVTRGTGSKGFDIAYANGGMDKIYLNPTNWATGYLTQDLNYPDYDGYEVNYNNYIDGPVAITNDYLNTAGGPYADQVFVCWYNTNSGEIDCKTTNVYTPVFKPTEVMVMGKGNKTAVYPNPASDVLHIRPGAAGAEHYAISDVLGKNLLEGDINGTEQVIDIKKLPRGLYMLQIENGEGQVETRKIMKD